MPNSRIFIDTNIIIEAFRINCWSGLSKQNKIETVEKCIEEALTGQTSVNRDFLKNLANRHNPSKVDILNLNSILQEHRLIIDDGELHLFAFLHANGTLGDSAIIISTADRAAVRAALTLGWIDRMYSLEEILNISGVDNTKIAQLKAHFRRKWLTDIKTQFRFDSLKDHSNP